MPPLQPPVKGCWRSPEPEGEEPKLGEGVMALCDMTEGLIFPETDSGGGGGVSTVNSLLQASMFLDENVKTLKIEWPNFSSRSFGEMGISPGKKAVHFVLFFFSLPLTRMCRCLHPTAVNLIHQKSLSSRRASIQHLCRNMCVFYYVHVRACLSFPYRSRVTCHVQIIINEPPRNESFMVAVIWPRPPPPTSCLCTSAALSIDALMPPAHVAVGGWGGLWEKAPLFILTYHTQMEGEKKSRFTNTSCRHTFIISSRSVHPVRPRADPSPSGPSRD